MDKVVELYENMPVGGVATYTPPVPKQVIPAIDMLVQDGKIRVTACGREELTGNRAIYRVTFQRLK